MLSITIQCYTGSTEKGVERIRDPTALGEKSAWAGSSGKKKEALTYKFCRYGGALVSVLVAHCGLVVAERAAAGLISNRKMR